MITLLIPDIITRSVFDLTPELLGALGVKLLMLDLDNTLSPYGSEGPSERLLAWIAELIAAGIEPFVLSNNRGSRPEVFAGALGVEFAGRAGKPFPRTLLRVLKEKDLAKEAAALAGDQIFTDVLCAKRAGVLSIAVRPISLKNPFRAIRYALETPFRVSARDV